MWSGDYGPHVRSALNQHAFNASLDVGSASTTESAPYAVGDLSDEIDADQHTDLLDDCPRSILCDDSITDSLPPTTKPALAHHLSGSDDMESELRGPMIQYYHRATSLADLAHRQARLHAVIRMLERVDQVMKQHKDATVDEAQLLACLTAHADTVAGPAPLPTSHEDQRARPDAPSPPSPAITHDATSTRPSPSQNDVSNSATSPRCLPVHTYAQPLAQSTARTDSLDDVRASPHMTATPVLIDAPRPAAASPPHRAQFWRNEDDLSQPASTLDGHFPASNGDPQQPQQYHPHQPWHHMREHQAHLQDDEHQVLMFAHHRQFWGIDSEYPQLTLEDRNDDAQVFVKPRHHHAKRHTDDLPHHREQLQQLQQQQPHRRSQLHQQPQQKLPPQQAGLQDFGMSQHHETDFARLTATPEPTHAPLLTRAEIIVAATRPSSDSASGPQPLQQNHFLVREPTYAEVLGPVSAGVTAHQASDNRGLSTPGTPTPSEIGIRHRHITFSASEPAPIWSARRDVYPIPSDLRSHALLTTPVEELVTAVSTTPACLATLPERAESARAAARSEAAAAIDPVQPLHKRLAASASLDGLPNHANSIEPVSAEPNFIGALTIPPVRHPVEPTAEDLRLSTSVAQAPEMAELHQRRITVPLCSHAPVLSDWPDMDTCVAGSHDPASAPDDASNLIAINAPLLDQQVFYREASTSNDSGHETLGFLRPQSLDGGEGAPEGHILSHFLHHPTRHKPNITVVASAHNSVKIDSAAPGSIDAKDGPASLTKTAMSDDNISVIDMGPGHLRINPRDRNHVARIRAMHGHYLPTAFAVALTRYKGDAFTIAQHARQAAYVSCSHMYRDHDHHHHLHLFMAAIDILTSLLTAAYVISASITIPRSIDVLHLAPILDILNMLFTITDLLTISSTLFFFLTIKRGFTSFRPVLFNIVCGRFQLKLNAPSRLDGVLERRGEHRRDQHCDLMIILDRIDANFGLFDLALHELLSAMRSLAHHSACAIRSHTMRSSAAITSLILPQLSAESTPAPASEINLIQGGLVPASSSDCDYLDIVQRHRAKYPSDPGNTAAASTHDDDDTRPLAHCLCVLSWTARCALNIKLLDSAFAVSCWRLIKTTCYWSPNAAIFSVAHVFAVVVLLHRVRNLAAHGQRGLRTRTLLVNNRLAPMPLLRYVSTRIIFCLVAAAVSLSSRADAPLISSPFEVAPFASYLRSSFTFPGLTSVIFLLDSKLPFAPRHDHFSRGHARSISLRLPLARQELPGRISVLNAFFITTALILIVPVVHKLLSVAASCSSRILHHPRSPVGGSSFPFVNAHLTAFSIHQARRSTFLAMPAVIFAQHRPRSVRHRKRRRRSRPHRRQHRLAVLRPSHDRLCALHGALRLRGVLPPYRTISPSHFGHRRDPGCSLSGGPNDGMQDTASARNFADSETPTVVANTNPANACAFDLAALGHFGGGEMW